MRLVSRLTITGLATLGALVGGLVLTAVPALAAPEAPETSSPAKSITATTATLEGVVDPHSTVTARAGWYFAYSTEPLCTEGATTARELAVEGHAKPEHKEVTGLQSNKTYEFCLVAINEAGETEVGNQVSFTTRATPPKVDGESVSIKASEAILEAQANPNNAPTTGYFQYSTSATVNGSGSLSAPTDSPTPPGRDLGEAFGDQAVGPAVLTGLTVGQAYYYQAVSRNATGTTYGAVQSFTTIPTPAPNPIAATTATFQGNLTLNPDVSTQYHFIYDVGTECTGGGETPAEEAGEGSGTVAGHADVTELQPGAEYTVCFVTSNELGAEQRSPAHFTTLAAPPKVDGESASAVKATEATLEAQVNPNNEKTHAYIQYATSSAVNVDGALTAATPTETPPGAEVGSNFEDHLVGPVALTGLVAGRTYYYQTVATNPTGTDYGAVQEVTTVPAPHTDPVTAITATTATFNGQLTLDPLVATQFSFDFNLNTTECVNGATAPQGEGGTGSGVVAESTEMTELQPNATYSVCFVTSNAFGTEVDPKTPLVQFKTLAAPPKIDGESSSSVTSTEAALEAQVNPNDQETHAYLQYSPTATVNSNGSLTGATTVSTPPGPEVGSNYEDHAVGTAALTGLTADQTYYYQAVATNATGTSYGIVRSFTTQGAPVVSTGEAGSVTQTTATLSGTVDPAGVETNYYFAYISEVGYQAALAKGAANPYAEGERTALASSSSDETQTIPPTPITGLQPGQTYHYALIAESVVGVTIGPDRTLTTPAPTPPAVSTNGARGVGQSSATLSGTVGTNGLQTEYGFEIAIEPGNYGPATGLGSVGGAATNEVSVTLGQLQPGTTYYYRIMASNADGTSYGEPQGFTTPGFPTLLDDPITPAPDCALDQHVPHGRKDHDWGHEVADERRKARQSGEGVPEREAKDQAGRL